MPKIFSKAFLLSSGAQIYSMVAQSTDSGVRDMHACSLSRIQLFVSSRTAALPGFLVHEILQAILKWVVVTSSTGSS